MTALHYVTRGAGGPGMCERHIHYVVVNADGREWAVTYTGAVYPFYNGQLGNMPMLTRRTGGWWPYVRQYEPSPFIVELIANYGDAFLDAYTEAQANSRQCAKSQAS